MIHGLRDVCLPESRLKISIEEILINQQNGGSALLIPQIYHLDFSEVMRQAAALTSLTRSTTHLRSTSTDLYGLFEQHHPHRSCLYNPHIHTHTHIN